MEKLLLIMFISTALVSCQNSGKEKIRYEQALKSEGDSITIVAQQTLMKNLSEAIQSGGYAYAVDFCNAEAIPLTNSASENAMAAIQRISDRNRNPDNALKTQTDRDIFAHFKKFEKVKDTLVSENKKFVYYKRINLAMPTCMNCHGAPENIEPNVLAKIDGHYPDDKAKNYTMNELRGLWKVTYDNE